MDACQISRKTALRDTLMAPYDESDCIVITANEANWSSRVSGRHPPAAHLQGGQRQRAQAAEEGMWCVGEEEQGQGQH